MIKYQTYPHGFEIKEVTVTGETDHFYTMENGRREKKKSNWNNYFDTRADARRYLISKAERYLQGYQNRLKEAEVDLRKAKAIHLE